MESIRQGNNAALQASQKRPTSHKYSRDQRKDYAEDTLPDNCFEDDVLKEAKVVEGEEDGEKRSCKRNDTKMMRTLLVVNTRDSRVYLTKDLEGKPAATGDKHNIDWVPTLNLSQMEFKGDQQKEQKQKASEERAEREKTQETRHSTARIQSCPEEKTSTYTGLAIVNTPEMEPSKPSCSTSCATSDTEKQPKGSIPELLKDDETQIKEFAYMFYRPTYHVLHREYFRSDDKVRFYMGLPSSKILVATLNHVAPYVSQRTQTLDPYQEFIMVLIKLHLSISFQDLTYRFLVSAWGGKTCDKFLTKNCGFLNKLLPGDMVMADKGFTISDSVGLNLLFQHLPRRRHN
ncbi:hypothetical protein P5673_026543 [Acropora cervicornis]|uniref:DDE Tnp4 domain-containing protein n=1 Tax=Acropora cervicornis TaxID=6130 RepID=A0AAD9Q160_ACRCE|nr:hypothetical protein P5673_026543 [Acropora cervicornis]